MSKPKTIKFATGKAARAAPQTSKEAKQQISSLLRKNAAAMKALA